MSYARWGCDGSDVYVFASAWRSVRTGDPVADGEAFVCMHLDDEVFTCKTAAEMIAHLREHRERGDTVPEYAIERLESEKP